jgi:3-oxoadipate enol-lactonase
MKKKFDSIFDFGSSFFERTMTSLTGNPLNRIPSIGDDLASLSVHARDVEPRHAPAPAESVQEDSAEAIAAKAASSGQYVRASDGVSIYYEVHGSASAPHRVLFVAGLNATFEAWALQTAHFGNAHSQPRVQFVVMDNRGIGFSDAPVSEAPDDDERLYSVERMARDVIHVADAVSWSDFVIVGHSLGAMIAQRVALLEPTRVRGLLLASSRIAGGSWWHALPTWTGIYRFVRMRLAATADDELDHTLQFLFPPTFLGEPCSMAHSTEFQYETNRDWLFDFFRNRKGAKTAAGSAGQLAAARQHALITEEIVRLRDNPNLYILVVTGDEDIVVPPSHSRYAADALCGGALEVLRGCGHAVCLQRSDDFNRLVVRLCERAALNAECAQALH